MSKYKWMMVSIELNRGRGWYSSSDGMWRHPCWRCVWWNLTVNFCIERFLNFLNKMTMSISRSLEKEWRFQIWLSLAQGLLYSKIILVTIFPHNSPNHSLIRRWKENKDTIFNTLTLDLFNYIDDRVHVHLFIGEGQLKQLHARR